MEGCQGQVRCFCWRRWWWINTLTKQTKKFRKKKTKKHLISVYDIHTADGNHLGKHDCHGVWTLLIIYLCIHLLLKKTKKKIPLF